MTRFSQRSSDPELIDDLQLGSEALAQNLRELALTNRWLGGNQVTLRGLRQLLASGRAVAKPLTVADLGCGGGDMLQMMAVWFRRHKIPAQLIGIDANAFMVDFAQERSGAFPEITYRQRDVFSEGFAEESFDIATMTLFCHHFSNDQLIQLLRQLRQQARVGVVINDLHRHWLAYYSISGLSWLLRASYLYRHDSRLSVLRAFSRSDWRNIIKASGYEHYTIRWRWAFRWEITLY
jgi:SAM-dependent methyltransferase